MFLSSHCVLRDFTYFMVSDRFYEVISDSGLDVAIVKPNFTVNLCFNRATFLFQRLVLLMFFPLATENIILYLMLLTDVKICLKSLSEVSPRATILQHVDVFLLQDTRIK